MSDDIGIKAMRIISKRSVKEFWERHMDTEQQLKAWHQIVKRANWTTPKEVKKQFGSADILPNNRVVFDIKGNKYRLVVQIKYSSQIVFIRFIGTHTEYDKINATTI